MKLKKLIVITLISFASMFVFNAFVSPQASADKLVNGTPKSFEGKKWVFVNDSKSSNSDIKETMTFYFYKHRMKFDTQVVTKDYSHGKLTKNGVDKAKTEIKNPKYRINKKGYYAFVKGDTKLSGSNEAYVNTEFLTFHQVSNKQLDVILGSQKPFHAYAK